MSKIKEFFMDLSKSTKITLISCGCFVLLTLLILIFFVMFPITPSERAISKFGGEGLVYNDGESTGTTAVTSVTSNTETTTTARTTVTTESQTTVTFTTMSGYLWGNNIRTGEYGVTYNNTVTTTTAPDDYNSYEPGYDPEPEQPAITDPTEPVTEPPTSQSTEATSVQQPTTEAPTAPPAETTDPPAPDPTQPPTDPPAESPDDPPQL